MASRSAAQERALLEQGLTSSAGCRELVGYLMPVIQARVARTLAAIGGAGRRNLREEVEDLSQDVFGVLFADDAKVLRAWSPDRGLSLRNFVGMVARRKANAVMVTRKRNPWYEEPIEDDAIERALPQAMDAEQRMGDKELLAEVMRRCAEQQTDRGKRLLDLIIRQGASNAEVVAQTGLSDAAVYQWRSRLRKQLEKHYNDLMAEGGAT